MTLEPAQGAAQAAVSTQPAGWYPDGQGSLRWWDGWQWTQHVQPAQPAYLQAPQVVMQAPYQMVTTSKRHTSHGLHLFLTIITAGAWGLFVWLPITIVHMMHKEKSVTRVGY